MESQNVGENAIHVSLPANIRSDSTFDQERDVEIWDSSIFI